MFFTLNAKEYNNNDDLVKKMHRLRKNVFIDQLGWNSQAGGNEERDRFDTDGERIYLLWANDEGSIVYGSTRLIRTTQQTLLYENFR